MTFVINGRVRLNVPPDRQNKIQVRSRSAVLPRVIDLKFNGIHEAKIIHELWVVYGQNIITCMWNCKNCNPFGKFFMSYSELLSKFGAKSFQEYVYEGITRPVIHCDLVFKLRRVKGEANFISSNSKIVKRLRRRQYDSAIIERTICLVLGPSTVSYRSFLKQCNLTNQAVGTIWRTLSKPQRRRGPDPRPLFLLVGTFSAFGPELA